MAIKGKKVKVECACCRKIFEKSSIEYSRSELLKRRHFCSRSCSGKSQNIGTRVYDGKNLLKGYDKSDEFTPFRYFLKTSKERSLLKGTTDLTLEYIKELWEKQKGICCISGLQLLLPNTTAGWKNNSSRIFRASLDRIDPKKGYLQGNVRFISYLANLARNGINDEELITFCEAVVKFRENKA